MKSSIPRTGADTVYTMTSLFTTPLPGGKPPVPPKQETALSLQHLRPRYVTEQIYSNVLPQATGLGPLSSLASTAPMPKSLTPFAGGGNPPLLCTLDLTSTEAGVFSWAYVVAVNPVCAFAVQSWAYRGSRLLDIVKKEIGTYVTLNANELTGYTRDTPQFVLDILAALAGTRVLAQINHDVQCARWEAEYVDWFMTHSHTMKDMQPVQQICQLAQTVISYHYEWANRYIPVLKNYWADVHQNMGVTGIWPGTFANFAVCRVALDDHVKDLSSSLQLLATQPQVLDLPWVLLVHSDNGFLHILRLGIYLGPTACGSSGTYQSIAALDTDHTWYIRRVNTWWKVTQAGHPERLTDPDKQLPRKHLMLMLQR